MSGFPKSERLVSRTLMEKLFNGGNSLSLAAYPLRAVFIKRERAPEESPVQLLISVPKKRFHHAVDRNRVKRQIREAYRQHKDTIHQVLSEKEQVLVAFVWLSDQQMATSEVEKRIGKLLQRMAEKLNG